MRKLLIRVGIALAVISFLILGAYAWENIFNGVAIVSKTNVQQAQIQANNVVNQGQSTENTVAKQHADVKKAIEKIKEESNNEQDLGVSLEVNGEKLYGNYIIESVYKGNILKITYPTSPENLIKGGYIIIGNKSFSMGAIFDNSHSLNNPAYINESPKFLKSIITPEEFKSIFGMNSQNFNMSQGKIILYTLKNAGYSTINIVQGNNGYILCAYGKTSYLAKKK